jgi:hypothetical protein
LKSLRGDLYYVRKSFYVYGSGAADQKRRAKMGLVLLIILILLLIGAVPSWPYSRSWGYWPSGGVGVILVIVLILLLLGRI